MPKLSGTTTVTTTTKAEISTKLANRIKNELRELAELDTKRGLANEAYTTKKVEIETLFADANEYGLLEDGIEIEVQGLGAVPLKLIQDTGVDKKSGLPKRGKLNITKLLKKFKKSLADLESCYDAYKPRATYLGIYLPGKSTEGSEE